MAWTTQQMQRLEKAIASGALTVRYADRTVTYRNQSEMLALLEEMRAALGLSTPQRTRYASTSRGF